ncbi:MAG TPA: CBS domain-containing protein [Xanthobacteraceae bacterium]|nr:CBS domain-containing protein [Xanthobacteraceae bacterium]
MTIGAILAAKGRDVVTIEPAASLAAAARLLAAKRIGAVVILRVDRRIAGILSERDIVELLCNPTVVDGRVLSVTRPKATINDD